MSSVSAELESEVQGLSGLLHSPDAAITSHTCFGIESLHMT